MGYRPAKFLSTIVWVNNVTTAILRGLLVTTLRGLPHRRNVKGTWTKVSNIQKCSRSECLYKNHFMDCPMPRVETQRLKVSRFVIHC